MLSLRRTPFSSIICETVWISVVDRTGSSGASLPFESIRCDAKIVLINVDFPRPVCPVVFQLVHAQRNEISIAFVLTNADDIELETTLEKLALDL